MKISQEKRQERTTEQTPARVTLSEKQFSLVNLIGTYCLNWSLKESLFSKNTKYLYQFKIMCGCGPLFNFEILKGFLSPLIVTTLHIQQ